MILDDFVYRIIEEYEATRSIAFGPNDISS